MVIGGIFSSGLVTLQSSKKPPVRSAAGTRSYASQANDRLIPTDPESLFFLTAILAKTLDNPDTKTGSDFGQNQVLVRVCQQQFAALSVDCRQ